VLKVHVVNKGVSVNPGEKRAQPKGAGEAQKTSVRVYYEDAETVIW
jgi:hypothetical protein